MADLLFVAITIAFFAIAIGAVKLCDRIIGPETAPVSETEMRADGISRGAETTELGQPDEFVEPVDDETLTISGARR